MKHGFFLLFCALAPLFPVMAAPAMAAQTGTNSSGGERVPVLRLMTPVACTTGQDCWIVNHVDMNPASGEAQDYTCARQSFDGHEGVDFGLRDAAAMKAGVSVLAAAGGRVLRVRDTMEDIQPTPDELEALMQTRQSCGNGVLIDHGHGWQSISCQLKKNSILVKPGDTVTTGQKIAEIGQSGAAEFPHLHFGLFYQPAEEGSIPRTVDPFSGSFADQGCGKMQDPFWEIGLRMDYDPFSIFASGFANMVPDFDAIRDNAESPDTIDADIDAFTFWAGIYGLRQGDRVTLEIVSPDGTVFASQTNTQESDRARQYYFVGRRVGDRLPAGNYKGVVRLERALDESGTNFLTRHSEKQITVTP